MQVQRRRLYDDEEHLGDTGESAISSLRGRRTCTLPTPFRARPRVFATRHQSRCCMGPICIWTWASGDASSIISLGIIPAQVDEECPCLRRAGIAEIAVPK